jgi:hypothetical protein
MDPFGTLPMLSIFFAAAIYALPKPPTDGQVEDAAERWTEANLKLLDGKIAEYEEMLERIYAGKMTVLVDGKKASKVMQVRDVIKKINELKSQRDLARGRKWFRPLPGNPVDIFNKGIFYGRALTFVKQTGDIATFECESTATRKTEGSKTESETAASPKAKMTFLVRGLMAREVEENTETDLLLGVPLYVSGRTDIDREGEKVRAIVLDVVDP